MLAIVAVTGGLAVPSPAGAAEATRIMIVGDSISQGSSGDWTWRYRLARHLTSAGASYDLVGPRNDLYDRAGGTHGSQQYMEATFDRDHDAVWGDMIGAAKDRIAADVTTSRAQLLLVHLGLNDLAWGGTVAATEDHLRQFIANARGANPDLRMLFGPVLVNETATRDAALAQRISDYNARLASVASALSTARSPLTVLGPPAGYDQVTDTYDGTHPNPRGEYRLAALYADGLYTYAGIGRAFGSIPDVPLLGTPASLTAGPADSAANLSWSAVPGADGYYVWQRNASAGEDWVRLPYPLSTTSWQAQLLYAGQEWQFRVQPVRGRDLGGLSPVATVVPTGTRPAVPTGLTAAPFDGEAELRWTEVAGATGYFIYQRDATAGEAWQRLPYPVAGSPWTAGLLFNNHTYEYRVTAANFNGESGLSNVASVTPRGPVPGTPSNLTAAAGDHQARLCWRAATGATGYMIYQKDVTAGESGFTRLPYPVGGTCFTAGLLANNHVWHFAVTAVNSSGESGFSNTVEVVPHGPVPAPPTGLTASAGESVVNLCWQTTAGVAYVVYQRDVTVGEGFTRLPYPVNGPCWQAGWLTNGHTYQFRLRAGNANGESDYSATVTATPQITPPGAPTNVLATAEPGRIRVRWYAAPGANNYHLYVRESVVAPWRLIQWNIPGTEYTFDAPDFRWMVRVVAVRYGVEGGAREGQAPVRPLFNYYNGGAVGPYPGRECTAYAAVMVWLRTAARIYLKVLPPLYLNAETWDEAARDEGYAVDHSPRIGDIAQWNAGEAIGNGNRAGSPGHVGIVAQVYTDPNGVLRVIFTDYNSGGSGAWGWKDVRVDAVGGRFIHYRT